MSTFQPVIPIFSTDHSVGDSILTVNKESTTKYPISVLAIAKTHKLKKIVVVDSNFSSFWQLYRNAKDLEVDFIYGQKIRICADINQKDENSIKTESNVIVIAKNSEGYSDLIQLYSQGRHGFYYVPRIDWNILNKFYTENLIILIPFYSSFLAYNTLRLNYCANPSFSSFTPVFLMEEHGLPFDNIITEAVLSYCKNGENYSIINSHWVYYYKKEDAIAYQTFRCINQRTTLEKPNLNHFGSVDFSFESYLEKIKC